MDSEYKLSSYEKSFITKERDNDFRVEQDVQHYKDYAAQMREKDKYMTGSRSTTFRPFCIIPDVVAIDLKVKHGIDVHAANFLSSPEIKSKFAHLMRTEYPELLTSAAGNLTNTGGNTGIIIN